MRELLEEALDMLEWLWEDKQYNSEHTIGDLDIIDKIKNKLKEE